MNYRKILDKQNHVAHGEGERDIKNHVTIVTLFSTPFLSYVTVYVICVGIAGLLMEQNRFYLGICSSSMRKSPTNVSACCSAPENIGES